MTCATNYFCSSPIISVFLNLYSCYPGPKQLKNNVCVILGYACLVPQLCPTLSDPLDCSPPGSSVHGDSPDKNTGVGCHALLQGIFPILGSNPDLLHCRQILYQLSHQGSPLVTPVAAAAKMLELCWTLCDPIDGSQPAPLSLGYSRQEYLEWVAISFSNWLLHVRPNLHQGA